MYFAHFATVTPIASAAPGEVSYIFVFLVDAGAACDVGAARFVIMFVAGAAGVTSATRLGPAPPPVSVAAPAGGMTLRGRPTRPVSTLYARAASSSSMW
jgi:hypothetical protein